MGSFKHPKAAGRQAVSVYDGTLCRAASPDSRSLGRAASSKSSLKIKVLGFDGAKVHDFLLHVALAEVLLEDLTTGAYADQSSAVQKDKAVNRASALYGLFLHACGEGPKQAAALLDKQHELQKEYLRKAEALAQERQLNAAHSQAMLSEIAFGLQFVKSVATAGVAGIGAAAAFLLVGPELAIASGIGITFDVTMGVVSLVGPSDGPEAHAVVVGFVHTMVNDAVGVAGSHQQAGMEATRDILQKTLSFPAKSSVFRSAASTALQLDRLLKTMGIVSAVATLYSEIKPVVNSFEQMQRERNSYAALQNAKQK